MSKPLPKISGRKDKESIRTSLPHTPSESDDEVRVLCLCSNLYIYHGNESDQVCDVTGIISEEIHVPSQQDPEQLIKPCLRAGAEHVIIG